MSPRKSADGDRAGAYSLHARKPATKSNTPDARQTPVPLTRAMRKRAVTPIEEAAFDMRGTFTDTPAVVIESSRDGATVVIESDREKGAYDDTEVDAEAPSFPVQHDETGRSVVDVLAMGRYTDTRDDLPLLVESEEGPNGREPTLVGAVPDDPERESISQFFPDFNGEGGAKGIKEKLGECHFNGDELVFARSRSKSSKTRFIGRIISSVTFPALTELVRKIATNSKAALEAELEKCKEIVRAEELEKKIKKVDNLISQATAKEGQMPKLKFSLLKTHSNIFVLSPMALDFVQDSAHGLAGKARLDDQAVLYWPKKNDTGQLIKWRPVYMIRITGAAIKAIQMAASGSQKMSSLVVGRTEAAAAKKDSFKPPKPGEWVDAEWFKEMLAKCTRDPECCEYFDPKEFAENVTMVISFDDQYKRVFYHVTVAFGKDEFAYRLYVNPIPRSDFEGEPSFYYGKEFCVLIKE